MIVYPKALEFQGLYHVDVGEAYQKDWPCAANLFFCIGEHLRRKLKTRSYRGKVTQCVM